MPDVIVKTQSVSTPNTTGTMNAPAEGSIEPHLMTFFSMNPSEVTGEDRRMMAEIGKSLSGKEPFQAIDELRNIRFRLGTPQFGTTQLQQLHKYLKLRGSVKEAEAQLKALENA